MERKTEGAQRAGISCPEPNTSKRQTNGGGRLALWVWRVYFVTMPLTSSLFYLFLGACLRLLARRLFGFDPGLLPSTAVAITLTALFMVVWFMVQVRHAADDRSSDYMDAVGRGGRS